MIVQMDEPLYSYEKLKQDAGILAGQYHNLIKCVTIGSSHDNRDILMLQLGTGRKHLLFVSGVHGRESINPVVMMALIEYYAEEYMEYMKWRKEPKDNLWNPENSLNEEYPKSLFGKCVYELLQTYTLLIIPLLNPDGYMISLEGFDILKNQDYRKRAMGTGIPYTEWKFNGRGVDINRNFPSRLWRPKGRGDYAASENETKALIGVFHSRKMKALVDIHSRGKSIFYHRKVMSALYNERQINIAQQLAEITGYELVSAGEEINPGDSGGNTVHYFSERFRRPALTIETVEEEASFPLDIKYRNTTFEELKMLFLTLGSLMAVSNL